jgi:hypothetical protein
MPSEKATVMLGKESGVLFNQPIGCAVPISQAMATSSRSNARLRGTSNSGVLAVSKTSSLMPFTAVWLFHASRGAAR